MHSSAYALTTPFSAAELPSSPWIWEHLITGLLAGHAAEPDQTMFCSCACSMTIHLGFGEVFASGTGGRRQDLRAPGEDSCHATEPTK